MHNIPTRARLYHFLIFLLASSLFLLVASCSNPTATSLPPTSVATSEPSVTSQPVEPTATFILPTPTPTPITIHYVGLSVAPDVIQRAAQEFGWNFAQTLEASPEDIRAAAQSGAQVIVVGGEELQEQAREIARGFPQAYFVTFGLSEDNLPPNVVSLGGPGSRYDQLGFVAGAVAGLATETQVVTAISDPNPVEGLNYRNGFLHGVRYTCPRCRVQFIDVVNAAEASGDAILYASLGSDVFFAAAGQAGDEALVAAAQNGARVIGSGQDIYTGMFGDGSAPGADKVLTSAYFDVGAAVYEALSAYHDGAPLSGARPFSADSGAVVLAPYRNADPVLNSLDQADLAVTLARLVDGSLETGIDPATGQER
jgi:basic membrane lipoprotein Med (substrate-binding protein (PBP1-ABC) superfamily)